MEADPACTANRRDRWILAVALGLVVVPLIVRAIDLAAMPGGVLIRDHALIELRVRDIGRRPVLLGLYSRDGWSHPGPLLFYTLALPYRLFGRGPTGLFVGATIVNAGAIAATAAIAQRLGGLRVALLTLLGLSLMVLGTGAALWSDPWVCFVTILPFALFCSLAWAMVMGRAWALPAAALLASWLAQTHVGYAPLVAPALVAGAVCLVVGVIRAHDPRGRRGMVIAGAVTIGLLALAWLPAVWDQAFRSGNFGLMTEWFRRAEEGTATLADGVRVVLGQFAVPPDWLTGQRRANGINGETTLRTVTRWPVVLLAFAAAVAVAWRRHDRALLCYGAVTAFMAVIGIVAVSRTVGIMYEYRLLWIWPLAASAAIAVAWAAWNLVADRFPGSERRILVPIALAGVVVASVAGVVGALDDGTSPASPTARRVVDRLARELPEGQAVLRSRSALGEWYLQGLVLGLESEGVDARVPEDPTRRFGAHRVADASDAGTQLLVLAEDELDGFDVPPNLELAAYAGPVPYARRMALGRQVAATRRELADRLEAGTLSPAQFTRALDRARAPGPALAVYRERRA